MQEWSIFWLEYVKKIQFVHIADIRATSIQFLAIISVQAYDINCTGTNWDIRIEDAVPEIQNSLKDKRSVKLCP